MNIYWKLLQVCPTYNPKYDPNNYLHIKEHEYQAYEEMTSEYLLKDENINIPKDDPNSIDIVIRDYRGKNTYRKLGEINIIDKGVRLAGFSLDKLDIFSDESNIIYYRLSDIYRVKIIANTEPDPDEKNRLMINIYYYMYRIAERNNKILALLKTF